MNMERTIFKMYIKEGCPFCDKARDYITKDLRVSLHTIDVTKRPHIHEMVMEETGQKTVPAVFLGNKFIGGCDDLLKFGSTLEGSVKILREEVSILSEELQKLRISKCD